MARTAVLGLPRIGPDRELKFALEAFWAGRTGGEELEDDRPRAAARRLGARPRRGHRRDPLRRLQPLRPRPRHRLGARRDPRRFGDSTATTRRLLRARARHRDAAAARDDEVVRHQLPLPRARARARAARSTLRAEHWTGPAARGGRARDRDAPGRARPAQLPAARRRARAAAGALDALVPVYAQLLARAAAAGATEVQLDEPCLALDRTPPSSTRSPRRSPSSPRQPTRALPGDVLRARRSARVRGCPPAELHLDLVRAPEQLAAALARRRPARLSLGVVDGRNVWAADLDLALDRDRRRGRRARQRPGDDRAVVLAAARALRGRARDRHRPRDPAVAGVRAEKLRRAAHARRAAARTATRDALLGRRRATATSARRTSALHQRPGGPRARSGALHAGDYDRGAPVPGRAAPRSASACRCRSCRRRRSARSRRPPEIRAARRDLREGRSTRRATSAS